MSRSHVIPEALARKLALIDCLIAPYLSDEWRERSWNGVRVWLWAEVRVPEEHEIPPEFEETHGLPWATIRDLVAMVGRVMDAIGDGLDPAPFTFDAAITGGRLVDKGDKVWVHGLEERASGESVSVVLPVLAMDEAAGWALTIHGLFRFDPGREKPNDEETLAVEDDAPPSPGGRP